MDQRIRIIYLSFILNYQLFLFWSVVKLLDSSKLERKPRSSRELSVSGTTRGEWEILWHWLTIQEELCRKIFNNAKNSKLPHELKSKNYPISHAKLSIPLRQSWPYCWWKVFHTFNWWDSVIPLPARAPLCSIFGGEILIVCLYMWTKRCFLLLV